MPQNEAFMTTFEREQKARNEKITSRYLTLKNQNPKVSDNRLFTVISREVGCTSQNVRNILIKEGMYQPQSKQPTL